MKKSIATLRAEEYKDNGAQWYCGFAYTPLQGLGYEAGIHRRDPSSVLLIDDTYYVWYTKSCGPHFGDVKTSIPNTKKFPWDYAEIWYASSKNGINWKEEGCAIKRGGRGTYDERTVCTPDAMLHEGKIYLVYQALPQGIYTGKNEIVTMAYADSPEGPWTKVEGNIIASSTTPPLGTKEDNYNKGDFLNVSHDPMLFSYNDQFYLYYKCTALPTGELKSFGQDTRMGVAIADDITGPYIPSEFNPVTNSGHETMLWKYNGGIAALLNRDGPEKDTIQYSTDGIQFNVMSSVIDTPMAGGAFRGMHNNDTPLEGIRWGLCHYDERGSQWNYLMRFDIDNRHPYGFSHQYPDNNCGGLGRFW